MNFQLPEPFYPFQKKMAMTFCGSNFEGSKVRLMKSNFDKVAHLVSVKKAEAYTAIPHFPKYGFNFLLNQTITIATFAEVLHI
jgi:hypothetical protein